MESTMMRDAARSIDNPRVQEMIRELGQFGLGVFIPHAHTSDGGFTPLPPNIVQLESALQISFIERNDPVLSNATMVAWIWDNESAKVVGACACRGVHFPGNCSAAHVTRN